VLLLLLSLETINGALIWVKEFKLTWLNIPLLLHY